MRLPAFTLISVLLAALPAHAEEEAASACVDAMTEAQVHRDAGRLRRARDALERCARDACPEIVHRKCREWLPEVEASLSRIVVTIVDAGTEIRDARVWLDGALLAVPLDGTPILVDPGPHALRVDVAGTIHEHTVDALEGQEHRLRIDITPPPAVPEPAPPPPPPRDTTPPPPPDDVSISPLAWIGFGLAGAGVTVGTITGIIAAVEADDLETRCASPAGCPQADIDGATAIAHVATTSFAVAGAGAALGVTTLLISLLADDDTDSAGTPRTPSTGIEFSGPGIAGLTAHF